MAYPNDTPDHGLWSDQHAETSEFLAEEPNSSGSTIPTTDQTSGSDTGRKAADQAKEVTGTVKSETALVADTAKAATGQVVDTAKQEAGQVLTETKFQGQRLLDESTSQLRAQVGSAQSKVAELARSLSDELGAMSDADQDGMLSQYVTKAQRLGDDVAQWLDSNEPDELLSSVRRYAARNPWQFLAISAGVGFLGARIFRGLQGAKADQQHHGAVDGSHGVATGPYVPPTPVADPYLESGYGDGAATPSGASSRADSFTGDVPVVEPESRYEDLTPEGGDPWREDPR